MSLAGLDHLTTPTALGMDAAKAFDVAAYPATQFAKQRNVALDWLFYEVHALTRPEHGLLLDENNREGAILVVKPSGENDGMGIVKHETYASFLEAPGNKVRRFVIAGVGGSNLGAAALARTVANRYQEPVGAIVPGYEVANVLAEAMGGWLMLETGNRIVQSFHDALGRTETLQDDLQRQCSSIGDAKARPACETVVGRHDAATLLRLLLEPERPIVSLVGHGKGSLAIAAALEALTHARDDEALERAKQTRITTAGAVVELPEGFENVGQYLGQFDWFGTMNSRRSVPHETVPGARHHLNTAMPMHMDFAEVMQREPD